MDMQGALAYLSDLEHNNTRTWFHDTKARRDEAQQAFEALLSDLMERIGAFDPSVLGRDPKSLTFKFPRDTRFSHDKSPYNPSLRAHIGPAGKLPVPVGYYLMIQPDGRSFLGGGLFAGMFKDATARVRRAIAERGDEWEALIADPAGVGCFTVEGEALKRVPQEFDPDHPQGSWLKHKSWYIEHHVPDEEVSATGFVDAAAATFERMQPLNAFLNRALEGFEMPAR